MLWQNHVICHNQYWERTQKKPKKLKQYNQKNIPTRICVFSAISPWQDAELQTSPLCLPVPRHGGEKCAIRLGWPPIQHSLINRSTGALPHPISASHTRAHTQTVYQFPAKRLKCSLLECMLDDETNMQLIIFSCDPWRTSVYEIIFFSCKRHEYC